MLRRECLDHLLIYRQGHLQRVLAEYEQHYNASRDQRPPLHNPGQPMTSRL
ncbi:hypothetical protein [Actinoallomurus rhizosphaericola]|uniref:hypothetical protein n=1 Tax=Actinoallomurus rhizosphaericola TaxID=2952536 RepID=UPI002092398A|nr:hypothetical protein [Actinoallomurus rhizosphaericola]MCO6000159.1 hypothetical protein [Actinoallomurus rhizosphaericola]